MSAFKVGDRVQATEGCVRYYAAGDTGTVAAPADRDGDHWVDFDPSETVKCLGEDDRQWWVDPCRLELIPAAEQTT